MKKSLFTSVFAPVVAGFVLVIALLAGVTPVANAQPYYGNYMTQPYASCVNLTVFQGPGSTDLQTGGQVTMLQEFLNQTGYLSGVSGTFDNGTLGAVINYQRAYGIQVTGTVGPITRTAMNQQSCGAGVTNPYAPSYPVTNYSNGSNCYWTGATYSSTYVCNNTPIVPVIPPSSIYPSPIVCNNNYGSNYNYNYNYNSNYNYGNNSNYCGQYNNLILNSLSANYGYNTITITITGSGFTSTGNTVYFGNTAVGTTYPSNGNTLTFTVPVGYYSGTYGIRVTNGNGLSSNTLSFIMNTNNYTNGNYPGNNFNGYSNNSINLSNVSGPSNVQAGTTNTWTVTASSANNSYANVTANWGDGSVANSNGVQQSNSYGNSQTYSFSHMYQSSGTYTLRVTATNSAGFSAYSTYIVTVVGNTNYYQPYQYNYQYQY